MSSTGRGGVRSPNDYYSTPAWLTEAIIPEVKSILSVTHGSNPGKIILEPCCGSGAISSILKREFPGEVFAADLYPQDAHTPCIDFLSYNPGIKFDCIITNPPYSLALEFVQKGLDLLSHHGSMFMLLRLNWLGSKKRASFLRKNTPSIYVTPRRPSFEKGRTDSTEYAWFRWTPSLPGSTQIHILDTDKVILPKPSKLLGKRKPTWTL